MSSLSLATLGVQCEDRALSMATLGVFCGDAPPVEESGGGRQRQRKTRIYLDDKTEVQYSFEADQAQIDQELLGELEVPLSLPISEDAPALADIKDPVEREIAEIIRKEEIKRQGEDQQKRLEMLQMLDMELYFMVLALTDDDF